MALQKKMLTVLLKGDLDATESVIESARREGKSALYIIQDLIAGAMREVGDLWHDGEISVADEHLATETAHKAIAMAAEHLYLRPSNGKHVVVCCVPGEFHTLGPKMASELLYADGWGVSYLGNGLPIADMLDFLGRRKVDALLLSMTLSGSLDQALLFVGQITKRFPDTKILIGGPSIFDKAVCKALQKFDVTLIETLGSVCDSLREACGLRPSDSLEDRLEVIGARIAMHRKQRKWSQQELADAASLDRTYISALERGKQNVSMAALMRVAQALELPLEALVKE